MPSLVLLLLLALPSKTFASAAVAESLSLSSAPDSPKLKLGGYVDTYHGYDFNAPPLHDRTIGENLFTVANRSNEFNVNLAYLDARLDGEKVRGRLALQAGTSVQGNYLGEPTLGRVSGGSLSRHLQEAFVGYHPFEHVWIDAGIYLSHIGLETFISRDNWTYTRSLMADFSPYYQAGVRATWEAAPELSFQLHVMNGWQNISENNQGKALGTQVDYHPSPHFSVTYNTFFGQEVASEWRAFHDLIVKVTPFSILELAAAFDLGTQGRPLGGASVWSGGAFIARIAVLSTLHLAARVEYYADPDKVIVTVPTPSGFRGSGASLNADVELVKDLLWRTEVRGLWATAPAFPGSSGLVANDGLAVTSLAYTF